MRVIFRLNALKKEFETRVLFNFGFFSYHIWFQILNAYDVNECSNKKKKFVCN